MGGLFLGMGLGLGLSPGKGGGVLFPAPVVANPTGGTLYVSGASPSTLPAGNDTTGNGSALTPYATLTKAISMVPAGGDYLILCDGTFAENTGSNGRWIVGGVFTKPILFKSYSGDPSTFIVTNTSGTSGVVNFRSAAASKIQFQYMTVQSATEGNTLVTHNPTASNTAASEIYFFDCVLRMKSHSSSVAAVTWTGNFGFNGFYFVRTTLNGIDGVSTVNRPTMFSITGITAGIDNQPHANLGIYDTTTTGLWSAFSGSIIGTAGITVARLVSTTMFAHSFLLGTDTSDATTPKCTNVNVYDVMLTATGSNPHLFEIGANVTDPIIRKVRGTSALQGIVCKGAVRPVFYDVDITGAPSANGGSLLYNKASTGVVFDGCKVMTSGASFTTTGFREGPDSAVKANGTTLRNCQINVSGASATAVFWDGASGALGNSTADNNTYTLSSGAGLGRCRGVTVASKAALTAAWVSNGLAGDNPANDANSLVA